MNRINESLARPRWLVVLFATVVVLQVMVAVVSIELLSSVRAYIEGESLYSKGQKDGALYLARYIHSQSEKDYQQFLTALDAPQGDRLAREALQRSEPDVAAAQRGFLAGGNSPDDVDGMVFLFVWFHDLRFMADAIATWTQADASIAEMRAMVERARTHIYARGSDSAAISEMSAGAAILNERLTNLEREFSERLSEAARQIQRLLIGLNVLVAAVLIVTSWHLHLHRSPRVTAL